MAGADLAAGRLRLAEEKKYKRLGESLLYYQKVVAYKSRVQYVR
jgi:hypothetical protein